NSLQRPHRMAKLVKVPETIEVASPAQLYSLAALLPAGQVVQRSSGARNTFDLQAWIAGHEQAGNLQVVSEGEWNGGRKWVLGVCPFDAAQTNRSAVITETPLGMGFRCLHNSCSGKNWKVL